MGVLLSLSLLYISRYMGRQFEDLSERGVKVGERDPGELEMERLAELEREDTSCGVDEEGQGTPLASPSKAPRSAEEK